jgi:hypothetical protein
MVRRFEMYINGFTRESVMAQIKAKNMGYPSYDEDRSQCMYRNFDGNQCLVGCFIPDNLYEEDFEGDHAEVIFEKMPDIMPIVKPMLRKLQNFHDGHTYIVENANKFFKDIENKLIELEKQWEQR